MATVYKTPGVYVEEISSFPPSVAPVATAIPAFIGYTEMAADANGKNLTLKPTRISSLVEYEKFFGLPQKETEILVTITTQSDGSTKAVATLAEHDRSKHIMYYALQMFFANGGGPCYIVSVGPYKTIGDLPVESELKAGLDAVAKEQEPTLIVFPEAQAGLSIANFKALHDAALLQCATLKDRFVIMDVHGDHLSLSDANTDLLNAVNNFRGGADLHSSPGIGIDNLKYGAAYAPNLETVLTFDYDPAMTKVKVGTNPEVSLDTLQNPTISSPHTSSSPPTKPDNQSYHLALAAIGNLPCTLPPAAAMAGIYAAVDNARGVWKAPANVGIINVIAPTIQMDNDTLDNMNVDTDAGKSVNAIRPFIGKGTLVWGARTLAGNDNDWRYINVRRLFIFVEESVKRATAQFVFEANDANTWVKVQGMIENFLTTLWRQGALQGVKPEHAFYVAVGLGKTMTGLDILEGRMIVEIGMAAVHPAEFIILRFTQMMAQS